MRAQRLLRLSQGLTLQRSADEFGVHLNNVEQWRQRWNKLGLAELYEGRHTGRPKKWTPQQQILGEMANSEGGTVRALLRQIEQSQHQVSISESTAKRYLKEMDFTYKRYRYSISMWRPTRRPRPANTRCAWNLPMTAAAPARAAPPPCTSMAARPAQDAYAPRRRRCSRPTTAAMSAATAAPVSQEYGPKNNAFSGQVKGVQLAIAEDAGQSGNLVSPEDALRIAMARQ